MLINIGNIPCYNLLGSCNQCEVSKLCNKLYDMDRIINSYGINSNTIELYHNILYNNDINYIYL